VTDQATRTHVVRFMLVARHMGSRASVTSAGRALMKEGYIALDLPIDPSASRERGSAAAAALGSPCATFLLADAGDEQWKFADREVNLSGFERIAETLQVNLCCAQPYTRRAVVDNRDIPDICLQHMIAVMLLDGTASGGSVGSTRSSILRATPGCRLKPARSSVTARRARPRTAGCFSAQCAPRQSP
jgi:hypothetical protein